MSDQWGPAGSSNDDGEAGRTPPPPPPPPSPGRETVSLGPIMPVLTLDSEAQVTRSGGVGGRVLAGVVGALLLVGGTVFAVSQLGSSGPGSPEDAVAELLEAASNEDVLGLLAALDPGEREALQEPVEALVEQLERLEVLDESFALDGIDGIDLEFEDVTYRTEPVRDDLARVYFTGGTVTGSINADEIPIGDFVSDTLDRFDADISGVEESETSDLAEEQDTFLVARNGSDGWRVSIGYTAAEAARLDAGMALPDPIVPIGADSPEEAVAGLFQAGADLDLRGLIARLSPAELGALQDYAGIFIDDAAAEMAAASDEFDITIDDLSLRSDGSGNRASVFVEGFAVSVTSDELTGSVSYADECFSVDGNLGEIGLGDSLFSDGPVCVDDFDQLVEDFYGSTSVNGFESDYGIEFPTFPSLENPTVGITTTKVDGKWFVAPIATSIDALVATLEVLERSHLDAIVDFVEQMITAFEDTASYEESFEEIGDSLTGDFYDPELYDPDFDEYQDLAPPTSRLGGATGSVDEAALEEFVRLYAGDPALADCILFELSFADEHTRFELADAYAYDYEPSIEAQDVFFTAFDVCGQQ